KKQPVVVRHRPTVDRQQPVHQAPARRRVEWLPEFGWYQCQREPNRRHFDKALVALARFPPILWMHRVASVGQSAPIQLPVCKGTSSSSQRCQAPQGPGEALKRGGMVVVVRPGETQVHARATWAEVALERSY